MANDKSETQCESCYELLSVCDCEDTSVTDDNGVRCPYCGYLHTPDDSYWYSESSESEICSSCEKDFRWIGEPQGFTWTATRD